MIILSIDSSSQVATCALLKDNVLLGEYILNDKKEHSVILLPMIEKLLSDNNINVRDIDGYVVSKGPGSFTGLRIGMATIKGMSLGSSKPYVSVSSLDALAYSVSSFEGIICPMMDALRENVYTCLFRSSNGVFERISDYSALDLDEIISILKEKNEKVMFVGDGSIKHRDYLKENYPNGFFPPSHLNIIRASSLGEIGMKLLLEGKADDPNSAPLYLKKPQAQRELEKRMGMMNGL